MSSFSRKYKKVIRFYAGVRTPEIFALLAPFGLKDAVLEDGKARLQTAVGLRTKALLRGSRAPSVYARCEEFQSLWFPIARATLTASFPELSEFFFEDLIQRKGTEAPLGVTLFVKRMGELERDTAVYGEDGAKARALLGERGLTQAVLEEANALLEEWGAVPESPVVTPAEADELERAMDFAWAWYVEWSRIARTVLKRPRDFRLLGIGRRRESGPELEAVPPVTTVPVLVASTTPAPEPSDEEASAAAE